MPTATLEELSNQHKSKKIDDGTEMKETELNVLQIAEQRSERF